MVFCICLYLAFNLGQVGKYDSSGSSWSRPEEISTEGRVIYKIDAKNPGQDVAAETAAALAATAILFKTSGKYI